MKRRNERLIWLFSLVAVLGLFYIVPTASSFKNEGNSSHYDKILNASFQYLNEYFVDSDEVDIKNLYYGALQGMYEATGDPYTTVMEPKVYKQLMESIRQEFEGIGAYVGMRDNRVVIISPIEGTPAYRAGIKAGDLIMKIDDKDTEGMKLDEAVSLLKGPSNTEVRVEVFRRGQTKFLPFTMKRQKIEIPSVKSEYIKNSKTGYLRIISFGDHTPEEVRKRLQEFNKLGIKNLVVDLRYNPGGSLESVNEVADMFLDEGLVVYTIGKKRVESKRYLSTDEMEVAPDLPMAVLINKGSASASEILSGALKDRKRAVIVGEKSFGKGSVQNVFPIPDKGDVIGLKITIAKYYTPGGYVIDKNGIEPDVKVDMPKLSDEEEFHSVKLMESKSIQNFVEKHKKNIPEEAFRALQKNLQKDGINIRDMFVKKLIREEQKMAGDASQVDLEFDTQLLKALEILRKK